MQANFEKLADISKVDLRQSSSSQALGLIREKPVRGSGDFKQRFVNSPQAEAD